MVSHKKIGGMVFTAPSPIRFKKRASQFNRCVGEKLKHGKGPVNGGRYDTGWQSQFTAAVHACGGRRAPKRGAPKE